MQARKLIARTALAACFAATAASAAAKPLKAYILVGQLNAKGKHAMKFGPELGFGVTMREHLTYTEEELQYIAMNRCNKGYHYLGSAKILGRIGEAFAKAMIELKRP